MHPQNETVPTGARLDIYNASIADSVELLSEPVPVRGFVFAEQISGTATTITVIGLDKDGTEQTEDLSLPSTGSVLGLIFFYSLTSIIADTTTAATVNIDALLHHATIATGVEILTFSPVVLPGGGQRVSFNQSGGEAVNFTITGITPDNFESTEIVSVAGTQAVTSEGYLKEIFSILPDSTSTEPMFISISEEVLSRTFVTNWRQTPFAVQSTVVKLGTQISTGVFQYNTIDPGTYEGDFSLSPTWFDGKTGITSVAFILATVNNEADIEGIATAVRFKNDGEAAWQLTIVQGQNS